MPYNRKSASLAAVCSMLLIVGSCRKAAETDLDRLSKGVWVLNEFSVGQTGGGTDSWSSSYHGDNRDFLDFHADGSMRSGDAWNGERDGRFRLTDDGTIRMLISSHADTVSFQIKEITDNGLTLVEAFKAGSREVQNYYHYWRR